MKDTKKAIIEDLEETIKNDKDYLVKEIDSNKNVLYIKTTMICTIFQRSLSLIEAYKKLLLSNNIMVLNSLARMQLDNCIFIYGVHILVNDGNSIDDIYINILKNNKMLSDYKIKEIGKLYDKFIVEEINKDFKTFKNLYKFLCRFIHYSDSASFLTMGTKKDSILEISYSKDYKRFRKKVIENGRSFVEASKLISLMVDKYWKNIENGKRLNK